MAMIENINQLDFSKLRQRSLERLSRIPAILRKNRPKKTKPEPIIFQNPKTVKNEPYSNWESENQKSKKKPPYSYMAMIEMALSSNSEHRMSLQEIYSWIEERFSYFKTAKPGWKNSVRHNLSLHDIFFRDAANTSKLSYWCMHKKVKQLPNIEDLEGPCIPQNRLPRPEPIVPISSNSFSSSQNESIFLKLEPVSSENSSNNLIFQTPKNRQVLSQISVNRLESRNSKFKSEEQKENVSPIVFADSDKTPKMPFRKRILGESSLKLNSSQSPPKSQDSGFQSDATCSSTLNNINCDPATPIKNCSFDAIVDNYYVGDINEMNFSRDSFMDFINDLATPFSALSSAKKGHSSKKKYRSPFNPIHSSTPARKLDFGNKRKSSSRALFQDELRENVDESPIPAKRIPTSHKIEDLLP